MGPTATGKSALAMEVATRLDATILSVDSMQVFRGMDIGTAKPSIADREAVPHLMIDVADPEDDFSVAQFQTEARAALEDVGSPVLVVGGSGLHFRAVVDPLEFPPSDPAVRRAVESTAVDDLLDELRAADPAVDRVIDTQNPRRVVRATEILRITGDTPSSRLRSSAADDVRAYRSIGPLTVFGVDRSDLRSRVASRVIAMRRAGLLDEVQGLRHRFGAVAAQAVGYKELIPVVDGTCEPDDGFDEIERATWALVNRQRTYFRRDPRIRWVDGADRSAVEQMITEVRREVSSWTS